MDTDGAVYRSASGLASNHVQLKLPAIKAGLACTLPLWKVFNFFASLHSVQLLCLSQNAVPFPPTTPLWEETRTTDHR